MKIRTIWQAGKYPSFNLELASKDGAEAFLKVRGCKIMNGSNGEFVSWPSRKKDDGTYWNHVYASNDFNAAVLQKAKAGPRPAAAQRPRPATVAFATPVSSGFDDMSDDIPF